MLRAEEQVRPETKTSKKEEAAGCLPGYFLGGDYLTAP
jgi:hypothetical protein